MRHAAQTSLLIALLLGTVPSVQAEVSADCFAGDLSVTCALSRVDEAKDVDKLAAPVFERHGWNSSCYEVQYIRGDAGGADEIVVSVNGVRGGRPPTCGTTLANGDRGAMTVSELKALGRELKKALMASPKAHRGELLRRVKQLMVTNGWGATAEIPL
jgi:hypothetical protein